MNITKTIIAILFVAVLLLPACAQQQPGARMGEATRERLLRIDDGRHLPIHERGGAGGVEIRMGDHCDLPRCNAMQQVLRATVYPCFSANAHEPSAAGQRWPPQPSFSRNLE